MPYKSNAKQSERDLFVDDRVGDGVVSSGARKIKRAFS